MSLDELILEIEAKKEEMSDPEQEKKIDIITKSPRDDIKTINDFINCDIKEFVKTSIFIHNKNMTALECSKQYESLIDLMNNFKKVGPFFDLLKKLDNEEDFKTILEYFKGNIRRSKLESLGFFNEVRLSRKKK